MSIDVYPPRPVLVPNTVSGLGLANKLAVWNAGATQSYHTNLHYDLSTQRLGIGTAAPTGALDVVGGVLASDVANAYFGIRLKPTAPSGAVATQGLRIEATTGAAAGTTNIRGIAVLDQPISSGTVYGLELGVSAGTGRYNINAYTTAQNYFAGAVGMGLTPATGALDVVGSIMCSDGAANRYFAIRAYPQAPASATAAIGLRVEAATGAGLSTASLHGVQVLDQPVASSVFALRSMISAGTNRYNVYCDSTAQNYFAGNVGILNATPTYALDVSGQARISRLGLGAIPPNNLELYAEYASCTRLRCGDNTPGTATQPAYPLDVAGEARVSVRAGIGMAPSAAQGVLNVGFTGGYGIYTKAAVGGTQYAVVFVASTGGAAGAITHNDTTTTYGTSSDVRLKHAVQALGNALAAIQALRPVRFRWNANDSADEGFLAHELQQVMPHAVTGEPDAMNADGSIRPQQVDYSKLVVWLVGAVQELAARLDAAGG